MREHEMDNSRPAARTTPPIVLWLLFAVAVGGAGLLATARTDVVISSAVSAPIEVAVPGSEPVADAVDSPSTTD